MQRSESFDNINPGALSRAASCTLACGRDISNLCLSPPTPFERDYASMSAIETGTLLDKTMNLYPKVPDDFLSFPPMNPLSTLDSPENIDNKQQQQQQQQQSLLRKEETEKLQLLHNKQKWKQKQQQQRLFCEQKQTPPRQRQRQQLPPRRLTAPSIPSSPPPSSTQRRQSQQLQLPMRRGHLQKQQQRRNLQVSPGLNLEFRGAHETWRAMEEGMVVPWECCTCRRRLVVIEDAQYVLCPDCRTVALLETSSNTRPKQVGAVSFKGGLGLGVPVSPDEVVVINKEQPSPKEEKCVVVKSFLEMAREEEIRWRKEREEKLASSCCLPSSPPSPSRSQRYSTPSSSSSSLSPVECEPEEAMMNCPDGFHYADAEDYIAL